MQSYAEFDNEGEPIYLWGIARDITERRKTEKKIIENKEKYTTLFQSANDAIFIIDKERFIECNEQGVSLFGCTDKKEILGSTIWDFAPDYQPDGTESKKKGRLVIDEALAGKSKRINWKYIKKNGQTLDSEVSLNNLDIGGKIVIQAIVRDVTEVMDFQRRITQSEEKYRNLFENAPMGIFVADDESNIVDANPAAEKTLGYSRDELIGKNATELIHPGDLEKISLKNMRNLIKRKGIGNIERRYITKDGRSLFTEVSLSRLRYHFDDGRHMIMFKDITERKEAVNALKESETKARSILNASPLAIVLLDRKGIILDTNEEHASRLKRKKEDILGKCVWDLLPESVRSNRKEQMEKVFETGESFLGEDERDGIWNEFRIEPVRIENKGEIEAVVVEALDITERKEAEIALRISEERYRLLAESANNLIILYDLEGKIQYINQFGIDLIGIPERKILGKDINKILNGHSSGNQKYNTKKILNDRIKKEVSELKINTSDRGNRFLEIIKTPIEKDGMVEGTLIIGHDITEMKRAQKELEGYLLEMKIIADMVVKSSHMKSVDDICNFLGENIHSLNRDSYLAISLYDPHSDSIKIKGVFGFQGKSGEMVKDFLQKMGNLKFDPDQMGNSSELFVTGKLEKVPGGLYDILAGKIPKDLCHMAEKMLEIEEVHTVGFALGKRPHGGISILKKKGGKIRFRSVIETLANHSSVIMHQKQAESKLNRSEEEKNLILNTTEEMFAYYDTDLRIQWLNPASAESIGMKIEDMIGEHCYKFWNGSDGPCEDCPVLKAKETKKPQKIRKRTPDGRHWYLRGYPVLDERGEVSGLIEVGLDITDRVEAENKLEHEKERAEFYLDLLGHDLGNIHQGISGAIQLTRSKIGNNPNINSCLDIAGKAVKDSINLTRDVMLLSRIMKGKPIMEVLNLRIIIDKALEQVKRMFHEKEIRIDLDLREKYVLAEPLLMEVFINLFHNAVKLQNNKPRLEINSREKNGWIIVSICDWGPGIPDEMKKDLFRKYGFKGEKTRTGMGLSIVKSLVERYHGDIDIQDRIEGDHSKGACFVMRLPST